jgi:methylated-DNA-[protein]-cysteine S-methyltransferase
LTLASDGNYLTGLWIEGQNHFAAHHSDPILQPDLPVFNLTTKWLADYFAGTPSSIDHIPLKPTGSPFRQQVWKILAAIPWGQTVTYGQIAAMLGNPKASQAVGNAVGHNPISIIIPCHRVLGAGQSLTGYAGGIDKKQWLLRHEHIL